MGRIDIFTMDEEIFYFRIVNVVGFGISLIYAGDFPSLYGFIPPFHITDYETWMYRMDFRGIINEIFIIGIYSYIY